MILPLRSLSSIPKTLVSVFIFDICITSNIFAIFLNLLCYFEDSVMILFDIGNYIDTLLNVIHYPPPPPFACILAFGYFPLMNSPFFQVFHLCFFSSIIFSTESPNYLVSFLQFPLLVIVF